MTDQVLRADGDNYCHDESQRAANILEAISALAVTRFCLASSELRPKSPSLPVYLLACRTNPSYF